jgi:hypothetical protein
VRALRGVTVFGLLYVCVLLAVCPGVRVPGVSALVYFVTGFLALFPIDRVPALAVWLAEATPLRDYKSAIVANPRLVAEQREWRFLGTILEERS